MPTPSYDLYFKELADQDPQTVCNRALCGYDETRSCYHLSMWGQDYAVFPGKSRIDRIGKNTLDPENFNYLFIIQYLLRAKEIGIQNQWISEKDIPGGPTFFRGPHEIPTNLIVGRFGNDLDGFKQVCEQLNGTPIAMGDSAYRFQITPRIPVLVLYWIGDEDFPAEAKILYDKTITDHLASDIIFVLAVGVCNRIGKS
ncbi:MAG: DUF3786 domain-containing protein [Desulfobacteraceae bacterium]|nr:DUF3786 domain-containing protein [Desulfobacteraceae bacterium]MBU4055150.1 DUF3786 domain-containing protein [Pseudomonadota bacterium]